VDPTGLTGASLFQIKSIHGSQYLKLERRDNIMHKYRFDQRTANIN
jgi:hypothetical protein